MTYEDLVAKRKNYDRSFEGFVNPSQIEDGKYDIGEYLEPWSRWHHSIPADILVVGQDWGNYKNYVQNHGRDLASNPTCANLKTLFNIASVETGTPEKPICNFKLHFTNLIPFIRTGPTQGDDVINKNIIRTCADEFLKPLIAIAKPEVIITLGSSVFEAIKYIYDLDIKNQSFTSIVENAPYIIDSTTKLFPVFHCGASSINRNRNINLQMNDWRKLESVYTSTKNKNLDHVPLNSEARNILTEICHIALQLQEIYTLEAVYNDLRLSEPSEEYYEKWRAVRNHGYRLGDELKRLANNF